MCTRRVHTCGCTYMCVYTYTLSGVPNSPFLHPRALCTCMVLYELGINVRARVCPYHHRLICVVCVCVCMMGCVGCVRVRARHIPVCAYVYVYAPILHITSHRSHFPSGLSLFNRPHLLSCSTHLRGLEWGFQYCAFSFLLLRAITGRSASQFCPFGHRRKSQ